MPTERDQWLPPRHHTDGPGLKEALRAAAREHRSIANMVEALIRDYCGRNGIAIHKQNAVLDEKQKQDRGRK